MVSHACVTACAPPSACGSTTCRTPRTWSSEWPLGASGCSNAATASGAASTRASYRTPSCNPHVCTCTCRRASDLFSVSRDHPHNCRLEIPLRTNLEPRTPLSPECCLRCRACCEALSRTRGTTYGTCKTAIVFPCSSCKCFEAACLLCQPKM